jgi:ParB family chromosome partitioning protein
MGKEKPRLGRGLSSLMGSYTEPAVAMPVAVGSSAIAPNTPITAAVQPTSDVVAAAATESPAALTIDSETVVGRYIPLDRIDGNPYQPRSQADEQALFELMMSVREHGVIQPIVVRPLNDRYQLIAGHRRLEACRRCELPTIPAIFRQASERDMLEVALIENIHREDLNCVDRANAYRRYQDVFGLSAEDIAERLGEDRTTVVNYLRLLSLPDEVLQLLSADRLTMGHARALAGLDNPSTQIKLAVQIVQQGLSVRQAETAVAQIKNPPAAKAAADKDKPANIVDLEQQMTRALSTRVAIQSGRKKGSGKITIEFYNLDDFDRIMDTICGPDRSRL